MNKFFRHFLYFTFIVLIPAFVFSTPKKSLIISGKVTDEKNLPLQGVNIYIADHSIGTTSDEDGYFKLSVRDFDKIQITFQFIGYKKQTRTIQFRGQSSVQLSIQMEQDIVALDGVEISEKKYEPNAGIYEIKAAEIRTIPGFYSDALSVVKTLPGVVSNNEMSNTFHVHGGSSNDNLIMLESIRLPQPQQIRNSYQEGMSLINPSLVQNFQLMTGGFSARYGGKMHSVLLTDYKKSTDRRFQGEAELSLINAGLTLSGRAFGSGYWALAGRWADTGFILNTLQTEGQYRPKYMDMQFIARIPLNYRHKLNIIGLFLKNQFTLTPEDYRAQYGVLGMIYNQFQINYDGQEQSKFDASVISLSLKSLLTSELNMTQTLNFIKSNELDRVDLTGDLYHQQNVQYGSDNAEQIEYVSTEKESRNNSLNVTTGSYQNELTYSFNTHRVHFGWAIRRYLFKDHLEESTTIRVKTSSDTLTSNQQSYSFNTSGRLNHHSYILFAEENWSISQMMELQGGIRAHYFTYNEQLSLDPRLRLKWNFSPNTWLATSWGIYSQPPEYRELRDSEHNLLSNVRAQQSNKSVLSFYHRNTSQTIARIELFYMTQKNLIPYDFEDIFIQYQPEYTGSGESYGMNIHLYGKLNQRLNSWLSYTYLVSTQQIPALGEKEFPSPTDQRHTVSLVLQDDMPKFPGMRAHMRVLYGSGYPYTAYTAKLDEETGIYYPAAYNRMGYRMAYYRRIDVGLSYSHTFYDRVNAKLMFEIFNIFDFRNVLSYKYFVLQTGSWQVVRNNLSRRIFNFRVNISF